MRQVATQETTDEELMIAYCNGDLGAFEQLYHRHKAPLYRYFLRQGLTRDLTEELVQEVWSGIIKGRTQYQQRALFTTWLYQVAHHRLIDWFRRQNKQLHLVEGSPDALPDTPRESSDKLDLLNRLRQALPTLPFAQRQALLLHYETGMTAKQVAEVVQSNPEATKSNIRYAVQKLKQLIGETNE